MIDLLFSDHTANRLDISNISKFDNVLELKQLAIKYVFKGKETYIVNGKKHTVNAGEYLVANSTCKTNAYVNTTTTGVCVDLSSAVINEITNELFDQNDFKNFLLNDALFVNTYNSKNSCISTKLHHIAQSYKKDNSNQHINDRLFYELAECLILEQSKVFQQISRLKFKSQIVNHDNYKKLKQSQQFIDDCFLNNIELKELAQAAGMSKYRFVRLFKQTFGNSPYQYVLAKRLNFAKDKIKNGSQISEIAYDTGFADLASFSKAFKSYFGICPRQFI